LEYWKFNQTRFPILARIARDFFGIPVISAAIERIFSISSNIVNKNRNRLNPIKVKEIMLVKSWKLKDLKEREELFGYRVVDEEELEERVEEDL